MSDDLSLDEIPEWVKPGVSFSYKFTPDNYHHGRKFHIRGIVDGLAVIREWSSAKQRWNYSVEGPVYFWAFRDHIVVKETRQPPKE